MLSVQQLSELRSLSPIALYLYVNIILSKKNGVRHLRAEDMLSIMNNKCLDLIELREIELKECLCELQDRNLLEYSPVIDRRSEEVSHCSIEWLNVGNEHALDLDKVIEI